MYTDIAWLIGSVSVSVLLSASLLFIFFGDPEKSVWVFRGLLGIILLSLLGTITSLVALPYAISSHDPIALETRAEPLVALLGNSLRAPNHLFGDAGMIASASNHKMILLVNSASDVRMINIGGNLGAKDSFSGNYSHNGLFWCLVVEDKAGSKLLYNQSKLLASHYLHEVGSSAFSCNDGIAYLGGVAQIG